jgi:DNA adenine methylase
MSNGTPTMRPPLKWHGGKHYLAQRIVALFPEHHTYCEPFGGAASVLLNKEPVPVEIYNDLDRRLWRFFRVLRDCEKFAELHRRLQLTPYSEAEFNSALEPDADEIGQVRRDFVRWRLSIGGRGDAFSCTLHRVRRGMADNASGYLSAVDDVLPLVAERFRRVQMVTCTPATAAVLRWDSRDTLFYCDPPYLAETRTSPQVYGCEMTEDDHRRLAGVLRACAGKVVLSGYPSDLYADLYAGWRTVTFDLANHAAGGGCKRRVCERVWLNW